MNDLLPVVNQKITATVDSFFIPNKLNGGTDPSKYKDQAAVLENVGYSTGSIMITQVLLMKAKIKRKSDDSIAVS